MLITPWIRPLKHITRGVHRLKFNELLLIWLGLVAAALPATMYFVTDEVAHRRLFYVLGTAPILLFIFSRPSYWRELASSSVFLSFTLLIGVVIVSGVTTPDIVIDDRYNAVRYPLLGFTFMFAIVVISLHFPRFPWILIGVVTIGGAMHSAYVIADILIGHGVDGLRHRLWFDEGYESSPNRIATFYGPLAVFGIGLAFGARSRWTCLAWLLAAALCTAIVLLTQSRSGILGVVLALLALALLEGRWRIVAAITAAAAGFLALVELGGLYTDSFFDRYRAAAVFIRFDLWSATLERIQDAFWTGGGWMMDTRIHLEERGLIHSHPHNLFLETHLRAGIAGTVALLAFLAAVCVGIWKSRGTQPLGRIGAAALLVWFTHGFFNSRLYMGGIGSEFVYLYVPVALLISAQLYALANKRSGAVKKARESAHTVVQSGQSGSDRRPPSIVQRGRDRQVSA